MKEQRKKKIRKEGQKEASENICRTQVEIKAAERNVQFKL